MKIFFSLLFDQQTYPANIFMQNGVAIGDRHMGPLALFDFLELHLGLSNACNSKVERIFNYRENLKSKAKGSFYENSLQTNDLEVATKLLNWRDELKIAGWNFKTDRSCPQRLKDLANVEESTIGVGFPERFCNIIKAMNERPQLPFEEIIIHEPQAFLPAHLVKLFSLFAELGIKVKDGNISMQENPFSDNRQHKKKTGNCGNHIDSVKQRMDK